MITYRLPGIQTRPVCGLEQPSDGSFLFYNSETKALHLLDGHIVCRAPRELVRHWAGNEDGLEDAVIQLRRAYQASGAPKYTSVVWDIEVEL